MSSPLCSWLCAAAVVLTAVACRAEAAAARDSADILMRKGLFTRARDYASRAYTSDSVSWRSRYYYALFCERADRAEPVYAGLACDAGAPDSIRARAARRLADLAFVKGDYAAAGQWYRQAGNLWAAESTHLRVALADSLQKANEDFAAAEARRTAGPEARFALQVGSFSSVKNATKLKERLSQSYSGVEIRTVTINGITFYRVQLGEFPSPEKAREFAEGEARIRSGGFTVVRRE
jgi:hypothetical protein